MQMRAAAAGRRPYFFYWEEIIEEPPREGARPGAATLSGAPRPGASGSLPAFRKGPSPLPGQPAMCAGLPWAIRAQARGAYPAWKSSRFRAYFFSLS